MIRVLLTVIIKNTKVGCESEIIQKKLTTILPENSSFIALNEYYKFPDCYMLDFALSYPNSIPNELLVYEMLKISNLISRPWIIYFSEDSDTELIFSKTDQALYANEIFKPIIWAHLQISN